MHSSIQSPMSPFMQPCFHPVIHSGKHNTCVTGPINQSAVSVHKCQNKGGVTRQCEEGAQALLHITILRVFVATCTARAHPALLCIPDTKAYTIATKVAHRLMDNFLTSSEGRSLPHGNTHICTLGIQSIVRPITALTLHHQVCPTNLGSPV